MNLKGKVLELAVDTKDLSDFVTLQERINCSNRTYSWTT